MTITTQHSHRPTWTSILAVLGSIILFGCFGNSHKSSGNVGQQTSKHLLYSPNGEPLNGGALGWPTCQEALSNWFVRVDTDHNDVISREEFLADAQIQFRRMDIDNNGYLVSEEVERFRQPYRQQIANYALPAAPITDSTPPQSQQSSHKHSGSHKGQNSSDTQSHNDTITSDDIADPVMSADTNLDFKVTLDEFITHANKLFNELDNNHDGALSRDEVLALCK